ncbi:penicillin-binding protein 2, partial [bacterium]|nr:penicillin-binding protein 2 [bacterium]
IDSRNLNKIRDAMEKVISDPKGTGKYSRVPGIKSAGKTGTAQNPHGEDHAVFVAYAPVKTPRLAIAIVLENAGHGGVEAGPLAREIMIFYFHSLGDGKQVGDSG